MDFKKINSLTMYPSILTYHQLGERGRLNDVSTESSGFSGSEEIFVYEELANLLELSQEKIAEWRDHGNQPFYAEEEKKRFTQRMDLESAPLLATIQGSELPASLENTYSYLQQFVNTQVGIDAAGKAEGIIARTSDRKQIRKIRFEDYERTFKK